nr:putative integron gene cassette protein [uncultured bacterium]CAP49102.1 putative integron gene cassette protein [uncultured bacterium]
MMTRWLTLGESISTLRTSLSQSATSSRLIQTQFLALLTVSDSWMVELILCTHTFSGGSSKIHCATCSRPSIPARLLWAKPLLCPPEIPAFHFS